MKPFRQVGEDLRHLIAEEDPPSVAHLLFGLFIVVLITGAMEKL